MFYHSQSNSRSCGSSQSFHSHWYTIDRDQRDQCTKSKWMMTWSGIILMIRHRILSWLVLTQVHFDQHTLKLWWSILAWLNISLDLMQEARSKHLNIPKNHMHLLDGQNDCFTIVIHWKTCAMSRLHPNWRNVGYPAWKWDFAVILHVNYRNGAYDTIHQVL